MVSVTLDGLGEELRPVIRKEVDAALAECRPREVGFLDIHGAAAFLATTPEGVRALVKRRAIPFQKAPNGRILFEPAALERWVRGEAA